MENVIEVKSASKRFKETAALDDVSLSFRKGEIYGVVGRNGSGKTVLFKCICGLMYPDSGVVIVNGKRVGKDVDMPGDLGCIIEAPGFLPNYSGLKNLKFLAEINRKVDTAVLRETLQTVGLDPGSKKHVGKYSLGMRQRLGIAQAIMEDPDILILDEPMNGLDNDGVQDIRELLLKLRDKGKTILLASHSKEDIEILCDTVYEMDHGKVISKRKRDGTGINVTNLQAPEFFE